MDTRIVLDQPGVFLRGGKLSGGFSKLIFFLNLFFNLLKYHLIYVHTHLNILRALGHVQLDITLTELLH